MEKAEASATKKNRAIRRLKIAMLATAAGLILMFGLYFLRPANEQQIATVASLTGSVRWTGAGGQVDDDVQSGRALTGGTIECLSVDSSAAFEFRDGTTVTISGLSVLTISDDGQKELHLREGNLTAAVETQPEGKPLRVLTAAAELEVRGTQFDVIAAERQTKIIVNKGLVRVTRVAVAAILLLVIPAAGTNALVRWLTPWRDVERYTFAQLDGNTGRKVVPYMEPFGSDDWEPEED